MIGYKLLQKSGWNPTAGSSSSKLGSLIKSSAPRTMDTKYHGIGVGHSNNSHNNNNEQSADVFDHFRKAKSYTFNRYTSDPNRVRTADTCFRCGQPGHFAKNCQSGLY
ncbi:hypothetical protein BKA69DRAFT_1099295 [Paraphysoderma sedebokerense]|nr:hypothetical protein BKA69DRAFT_1099295 [Paraphysoderma sedebokerense]